jgi:hypothetical protein
MSINPKFNLHRLYSRRTLFVFVLFVIVFTFCFVFVFSGLFFDDDDEVVRNETELRSAVDGAVGSVIIVIGNDITLTNQLVIHGGTNVTLTSNSDSVFFKLFFLTSPRAITVEGVLILNGVVLTRDSDSIGSGVTVSPGGTFIMVDGEISGHTTIGAGGGVFNAGTFTMLGGEISGNIAGGGGGVCNYGVFMMSGGVISGNVATEWGGGVRNFDNSYIIFTMSGGVISNNEATKGGGVYHCVYGTFSLSGDGVISNNIADVGGGVCIDGKFNMLGGEISGNTARYRGGGLYNGKGVFMLMGGKVSDNTATSDGGGLYNENGLFWLIAGQISGNTATSGNGGGVWIAITNFHKLFVSNGVVFENNHASAAYNRAVAHKSLYQRQIGDKVTWTAPFTQGYNNYDISYTRGVKLP